MHQRGISRLSIIPVRAEGNDRSEQVTQLLFGDHYEVLGTSENGKWYQIRVHYDGYEGWIDHRQFTPISEEYYEEITRTNYQIALEPISPLTLGGQDHHVFMGSVLPMAEGELFGEVNVGYSGSTKPQSGREGWEFIRAKAMQYMNAPYLWGGRTIAGVDCSGFTQNIYRCAGFPLLRDASQQVKQGDAVSGNAMPGDLAFFSSESGNITHVGICLEEGKIIHASGRVRIDSLDDQGITDDETGKYTHQLAAIRRILKSSD